MKELLGHGAEGRVYKFMYFHKPAVVKERSKKAYRVQALDIKLTKQRLIQEARCMERARRAGILVPCLYSLDLKSSRLIMEQIDGLTLKEIIFTSDLNSEEDTMRNLILATKIGDALAQLHDSNIVHGDLTTSNMMATFCIPTRRKTHDNEKNEKGTINDESQLVFIDFGLATSQASLEDKAVDIYVLERAFASTHPHSDHIVKRVIEAYRQKSRTQGGVLERLDQVRIRGRKREMIG